MFLHDKLRQLILLFCKMTDLIFRKAGDPVAPSNNGEPLETPLFNLRVLRYVAQTGAAVPPNRAGSPSYVPWCLPMHLLGTLQAHLPCI